MKPERTARTIPVAIIGLAGLFPEARTLAEYWRNILTGRDCIIEVPPSRWSINEYYDPDPRIPDKTYCKHGGFIPELDFYPSDFGLPPGMVEVTDTSQLLGLFVARHLLEETGYGEGSNHERTAIVLGATGPQKLIVPLISRLQYPVLEKVLHHNGISDTQTRQIVESVKKAYINWNEMTFPGLLGNLIAGRIANRLNLGGTNCIVDAACASSFAALHMALSELTEYHADMVITGGIDTDNSIVQYLGFSKTPTFSHHDHARPFDRDADGMFISEGIGMVLLKRLEDVDPQRDTVYAIIKGMGTSSDGRHMSIYAPYAGGQVRALQRAYQSTGISPSTIGLIEAHGTGTAAGDKTEVQALCAVFGQDNPRPQSIALGSVKSQIGHTKAAAGVMGLIKAALALYHNILPPTINATHPNPQLALEDSPFYLNTETRPWIHAETAYPRRAAISSFGFGGTNYHVILEEHQPAQQQPDPHRITLVQPDTLTTVTRPIVEPPASLLLSAETPAALLAYCQELAARLHSEDAAAHYAALTSAHVALPLPAHVARLGCVVASIDELHEALHRSIAALQQQPQAEAWHQPGISYRRRSLDTQGRVVVLFSGQGSQYSNMGREVALNFAVMRHACACMDRLLLREGQAPLSERLFPRPTFTSAEQQQAAALNDTRYAQPALAVVSASLYTILYQAGLRPDFLAGHSFGELSALWAAGVLSDTDYFTLAEIRGRAMASRPDDASDAGAMLAVSGNIAQIEPEIQAFPALTIANRNSPHQVVLAGPTSAIATAHDTLRSKGYAVVRLPVSAAFHTPLVRHAQEPFARAMQAITFHPPQIPIYANTTGQRYPADPAAIREMLAQHLLQPVLFQHEIETIYADGGRIFIECGPRSILTTLVNTILGGRPHLAVALNEHPQQDSDRQLREAVVQLQVAGLGIQSLNAHQQRHSHTAHIQHKGRPIRLSGSNYVSEETKLAFEKALQDGTNMAVTHNRDSNVHTPPDMRPVSETHPKEPAPQLQPARPNHKNVHSEKLYQQVIESSERSLQAVREHLQQIHHAHEQFVDFQMESARMLLQMVQHHSAAGVEMGAETARGMAAQQQHDLVTQAFALLRDQQASMQQNQSYYERATADYTRLLSQALQQHHSVLTTCLGNASDGKHSAVSVPAEPGSNNRHSHAELPFPDRSRLQTVTHSAANISPATTSPQPQPQTNNIADTFPIATPANIPAPDWSQSPAYTAPAVSAMPPTDAAAHALTDADMQAISEKLLEVVVEKTGHPADIIQFDVDMEAELSIDSIKRFEILVAMEEYMDEHFPHLPRPDDEAHLTHIHTLGEIITYICGE